MKFIKLSGPLVFLLLMRINGTSYTEYWGNFEKEKGQKCTYTLVYGTHELVFNDSISIYDDGFDIIKDELEELGLYKMFTSTNRSMWEGYESFLIDSIPNINLDKWNELKGIYYKPVKEIDTVFSKLGKTSKQIKIALWQSLKAKHVFSVIGSENNYFISDYDESSYEDDEFGFSFRIEYSKKRLPTFVEWENLMIYKELVEKSLGEEKIIEITSLWDTETNQKRAYIIENKGEELFYDEYGFDALAILSEGRSYLDDMSDEVNEKYVLWYDSWVVYLLIAVQIVIYLGWWMSSVNKVELVKEEE